MKRPKKPTYTYWKDCYSIYRMRKDGMAQMWSRHFLQWSLFRFAHSKSNLKSDYNAIRITKAQAKKEGVEL